MATAFLGLGSNLGDREAHIRQALSLLPAEGVQVLRVSSFIETIPVGGPAQGLFINGAVCVRTLLGPLDLLKSIQRIETALGRVRTAKDGPRTIDIDILLYDDLVLDDPELTIPHPRMRERDFVMIPLEEIL